MKFSKPLNMLVIASIAGLLHGLAFAENSENQCTSINPAQSSQECTSYCAIINSTHAAGEGCSGGKWYVRNTCSKPVSIDIEKCDLLTVSTRTCSISSIVVEPAQEVYLGCVSSTNGISSKYRIKAEK